MKKEKMAPIESLDELVREINPPKYEPPTLERNLYGKFFDPTSKLTTPATGTYWTSTSTAGTSYVYDITTMTWKEKTVGE